LHLHGSRQLEYRSANKSRSTGGKWMNLIRSMSSSVGDEFMVNTITVPHLNERKDKSWCGVVWFSHCIPRHAFILWLAILGRLSTQDILAKWYPGRMDLCAFCEECPDSHEQLFFKCKYAEKVWKEIKKRYFDSLSDNWGEIVNQMSCLPCNRSIVSVVRRVGISASIFPMARKEQEPYNLVLMKNSRYTRMRPLTVDLSMFADVRMLLQQYTRLIKVKGKCNPCVVLEENKPIPNSASFNSPIHQGFVW
nr:hypothetical protein [Tanacetum cinerariifolium]